MTTETATKIFPAGTPVYNSRAGRYGFITGYKPAESRQIMLSSLKPIAGNYTVVYEDGHIPMQKVEIPDVEIPTMVESAFNMGRRFVSDFAERIEEHNRRQAEARQKAQDAQAEHTRQLTAFRESAAKRIPTWAKAAIVARYEEDESDSMTDYFHASTKRTVILGFSTHKRDLFPEMRKFASMFPETVELAIAPASAEHREKYSMGAGYYLKSSGRYSSGWKVEKQTFYGDNPADVFGVAEFLEDLLPKSPAPVAAAKADPVRTTVGAVRIEEHTHTKHGFQMWIVILGERVDRDEFEALSDQAKALDGWYSRPWGRTPGGFAFKIEDKAREFAATIGGTPPDDGPGSQVEETDRTESPEPLPEPAAILPTNGHHVAARLRNIADGLDSEIANKMRDRLTNTPKRRREADAARIEGRRLQRTQAALRALAGLHEVGAVPPELSDLRSKAAVYALMGSEIDRSHAGYYDAGIDLDRPATLPSNGNYAAAVALWALLKPRSEAERKADELRRLESDLQFANIPGFFPTPRAVVERMLEATSIPDEPCRILEPSAGSGSILDVVREKHPKADVMAVERQASLCDILKLKGHRVSRADFMQFFPIQEGLHDFVLMNPPFENGQDMAHVRHAFDFLKPGGRLVAIMSPGPFFRQDRKASEFRDWFDIVGGVMEKLPEGSFKESGTEGSFKESGTGTSTVLVVIDRGMDE